MCRYMRGDSRRVPLSAEAGREVVVWIVTTSKGEGEQRCVYHHWANKNKGETVNDHTALAARERLRRRLAGMKQAARLSSKLRAADDEENSHGKNDDEKSRGKSDNGNDGGKSDDDSHHGEKSDDDEAEVNADSDDNLTATKGEGEGSRKDTPHQEGTGTPANSLG
ncbi:hypothetical protein MPER_03623 [Moniliophthora perniciosa FA553]|nr:hypothetical protein MPER_03623 [Moniliophthora perniciosa FA553]